MYAILRTKKLKNRAHLTRACEHNLRLRQQYNIDANRSSLNCILHDALGVDTTDATSFQKKLGQYYSNLGIKEKEGNILAFEYVATASPKFFKNKTDDEIKKWAKYQVDFMQKEFGEQLKLAILHFDELTPHLHCFLGTEIKSIKKYKNRHGECHKVSWSLNSEKINPDYLSKLQTKFAKHNNIWGLRRGVKGSKRKNVSLKQFYDMVDKAISISYKEQIDGLINNIEISIGERLSLDTIRTKIREQLTPYLAHFTKQQKALKELLKLDFHKLQTELISDQGRLKQEQQEVTAIREVYAEAINGRLKDIQVTEMLLEQNGLLADEVERLRKRYEPDAIDTGNTGICFKNK